MDRGELDRRVLTLLCRTLRLDDEQRAAAAAGAPLFDGVLGLDSVDMVGFIVAVEQEFGIELEPDTDFPRAFRTVSSVVELVHGEEASRG